MNRKNIPVNKEELRELCKALNLHHLSKIKSFERGGEIENIKYLYQMLSYELNERRKNIISINKRNSNLPDYDPARKFSGINSWNLNNANKLAWFDTGQSLLIYGKCGVGKTDLACQICETLLQNKIKIYYVKVEPFLNALKNPTVKENSILLRKCDESDLVVLDELFYLPIDDGDLTILYKKLMSLLDKCQFIFISNRSPQEWKKFGQDKYIVETFTQRIVNVSRQIAIK